MNPTILCVLAFALSAVTAAPRNLFRSSTVHKQQTTSLSRQQNVQHSPRVQQLLTRMRNPTQLNLIRNRPTLMKKIQIDPHSRTVSIKTEGQPHIILKSRRNLRLKIHGRGGEPTKVINVMFRNRPSPQQQRKSIIQQDQRSLIISSALKNSPGKTGQKNTQVLQGQNKGQIGQNGVHRSQHVQTGSESQRLLGELRSTLEQLIRQKLLSSNFQKSSTALVTEKVQGNTVDAVRVTANTHAPVESKTESTSSSIFPSTTTFPIDYETEEPEHP
ncbi:uncharacterized protein LOC133179714 [Saccostrea echinata]|uniref:uncharacterized protein LOC133179714 n=1 Tax=Saccostrea echinata TaxID=191078 RepID=UPI002A80345C|nr:uncharacterized protein LOC133179714 [Saccostrea echinata]